MSDRHRDNDRDSDRDRRDLPGDFYKHEVGENRPTEREKPKQPDDDDD